MRITALDKSVHSDAAPRRDTPPELALRRACQRFESFFVKELIDTGDATGGGSSLGQPDGGSQTVHAMTREAMADAVSDAGGIGLWKPLYAQLRKLLPAGQAQGTLQGSDLKLGRME